MSVDSLFGALDRFRHAWVSRGWSWDRRFECVASTFDVTRKADAISAVRAVFSHEFDYRTVKNASESIATVAELTGGVRSDQFIYATGEVDHLLAYALWWPWGGEGTNISLRVGLAGVSTYDDTERLRQIFGALDD